MSFGSVYSLWFLLPLSALCLWSIGKLKRREKDLHLLGVSDLMSLHYWRHFGVLSALTLMLIAISQPRSGGILELDYPVKAEVVFVLDLSTSMLAEDVAPSRLRRAQSEISDIVEQLDNCRHALVVFANTAYPRMPLTSDKVSLLKAVNESNPDQFQSQGSHLAAAIQMALGLFDSTTNRVIVVVSDGEDLEQTINRIDPKLELPPIYALGVGTPVPSPMPMSNGANLTDRTGNVALTRRQDAAMLELAKRSSGAHLLSVDGAIDSNTIADAIMQNQGHSRQIYADYTEYFPWFVGLACGFLLLAFAPPSSWLLHTSMLSFPLFVAVGEAEEWSHAAARSWNSAHHSPEHLKNAAEQALVQQSYAEATFMYERLLELENHNSQQRLQLLIDAGLAAAQAGLLARALEHWEMALALDPSSHEATHNRKMVAERLAKWSTEGKTGASSEQLAMSQRTDQRSEQEPLSSAQAQTIIDSVREGRARGRYGGGSDARHPW